MGKVYFCNDKLSRVYAYSKNWRVLFLPMLFALAGCGVTTVEHDTPQLAAQKAEHNSPVYHTNYSSSGKAYYHIGYELTSKNLLAVETLTKEEFILHGGQFELRIDKTDFPIDSPSCPLGLILRMPWVPSQHDLSMKYTLYQNIVASQKNKASSQYVVIELNPYIERTDQKLTLTQCNIFFRHANYRYVPHTGPL